MIVSYRMATERFASERHVREFPGFARLAEMRFDWFETAPAFVIDKKILMPRTAIHPGEHLADELRESGITAAELSRQIDVPVNRITGIIHGQRGITADTALRLGHWFGTAPQFWMNLQQLYELRIAENEVGADIAALPRRADRSTPRKLGKTA